MDKYVTITKKRSAAGDGGKDAKRKRPMTAKEHMMHIATTPSTRGHDIWVSAATGHQISEQGGRSVSYNAARVAKLKCQFRPAGADVPADQKAVAARYAAQQEGPVIAPDLEATVAVSRDSGHIALFDAQHSTHSVTYPTRVAFQASTSPTKGCFRGCVFYLDGYLGPTTSDWCLKREIAAQGGEVSVSLAKKQITHVVLSQCGALAHSKIVKEGKLKRRTVQYVTVDWIHACLAAGKRVPEWSYSVEKLQSGTRPVAELWQKKDEAQLHLDAEEGERLDALDR
ncbi:hypothetical protein BCR37DRAFT_395161 [Protomyces lactucae-debilis]|uniref:BRCT domain-containing protein n=1 Tax=Protomyces lactucae-debilis TaxID=2754530 RepID=A0A1Y2EYE3_PROLT|nr:uncharacterized protein BCR37DRAFT_395161 [Protomyces lactucae-debilis]ORY76608.1 hypothetical protein BCR37DRAFT_395161 [Protomyces lactucae-debilis]